MRKYRQNEFPGLIAELVRLLEPETYVEIGVQRAWTFNKISTLVKRAVAVDMNPMPEVLTHSHVEKFIMSSSEFAKVWTDPIDFLLIDADHRKDAVLQDFYNMFPFIREGTGMIFLHDTHPVVPELLTPSFCNNAWEAAAFLRFNDYWMSKIEIMTIPGPWAGMSILRKSNKQLSWSV